MKLLLDTHIWLWSLLEPEHLSQNVLQALRSPKTELYISPITIWELIILVQKERVVLNNVVSEWVAEALSRVPIAEAPMTIGVALEADQVELPHRDPADRLIVATARAYELTFVTADTRILEAKACEILPNS